MAKNLKLTIKNTQIAEAINLGSLKDKLAKKKQGAAEEVEESDKSAKAKPAKPEADDPLKNVPKEDAPRIKARSKSAFAETPPELKAKPDEAAAPMEEQQAEIHVEVSLPKVEKPVAPLIEEPTEPIVEKIEEPVAPEAAEPRVEEKPKDKPKTEKPLKATQPKIPSVFTTPPRHVPTRASTPTERLGPTGRHMRDLVPPPRPSLNKEAPRTSGGYQRPTSPSAAPQTSGETKPKARPSEGDDSDRNKKGVKAKEYKDLKPARKPDASKGFDGRDKHGLRSDDEHQHWRKKRKTVRVVEEDTTIRPSSLKVRIPITIKDLAVAMKLKASQLIAKLFLQGSVMTLNDILDDETTIQLLGHEFGCEITIDNTEEERIRITDKSIKDEILASNAEDLIARPPVVAFMGHVDHGKTSLIDAIRKSNRAAGEAGAITQHIGAFRCETPVGDITVLDTPGHEAFSAMRARGAEVTDIVVLVVAGDEGLRMQTIEAIQHAKAAKVTIVVAINKSDKPNFNAENVYRQLSEQELLPEAWGGQTITINCSAVTGEGIKELLEMLALQAEVLELNANPKMRARGTVIESEMHKGMGAVATVLVQNGTLRIGDAIVFGQHWGRVKTMQDEFGRNWTEAPPSSPVAITGLSGLPEAGQEFIGVKNEKEAREIAEVRMMGARESSLLTKKPMTMESLLQQSEGTSKKILNLVLRADVQGSLEALKVALQKIESQKADLNIIFSGVGEISESDVQLAAASKAVILGFHTHIESHADSLVRQMGVQVRLHDIIYHAVDDIRALMLGLLDKIAIETDKGKAEVRATFKSSQHGIIAGCYVIDGTINRNNHLRVMRGKEMIHKGPIASLKRVKEDVREVSKGYECGILINNFTDIQAGDILEAFEVTYITQEL